MNHLQHTAPRPRVFVSSVINGFQELREAARQAIEHAGGEPILVNEDFPAQAESSRNVCLDAVRSCDLFVVLVGERGGWRAPSGKLVVEEEFEEAKRTNIPVRLFLQSGARDPDAAAFVQQLSDYVSGSFRTEFERRDDLVSKMEASLTPAISILTKPKMTLDWTDRMNAPFSIQQEPTLRVIVAPTREDEMFNPMLLRSDDFLYQVYEVGHSRAIRLLSYEKAKKASVQSGALIVEQVGDAGRHEPRLHVRLQVEESGTITIDGNLTGRRRARSDDGVFDGLSVETQDIESLLRQAFKFVTGLHAAVDQFGRFQQLAYNVAVGQLGYGKIVRPNDNSRTMNISGERLLIAHTSPRNIVRSGAGEYNQEVDLSALRLLEASK